MPLDHPLEPLPNPENDPAIRALNELQTHLASSPQRSPSTQSAHLPKRPQQGSTRGVADSCGALTDLTADRKRAEEPQRLLRELQEEQQLSRRVRVLTRSAYWRFHVEQQQLWWSAEHYPLWEMTPQTEIHLEQALTRVNPTDHAPIQQWLADIAAGLQPTPLIFQVHLPSQGLRWMQTEATLQRLPDGTAEIVGAVQDITESHQTQRLLESYQYSLDQSAIVAITDRRGSITYVNNKFCDISGYDRAELIGQNHRLLKSGQHTDDLYVDLWRSISRGHVWRGEICNQAKDGSFYWVDTTIVPIQDDRGRPERYLAIRFEITQRKLAEQENALLLGRLQLAMRLGKFGFQQFDLSTRTFDQFDARMCELYGLTERGEPPTPQLITQRIHPEDRTEILRGILRGARKHDPETLEYRTLQADGSWRWMEGVAMQSIADGHRKVSAIARDIHENKSAHENERLQLLENLEMSIASGEFGTFRLDPLTERYTEADERFRELVGFAPEHEISIADITSRMHPDDVEMVRGSNRDLLGGRCQRSVFDVRIQHPQGGWRWVRTHRHLRTIHGQPYVVGLSRDITIEKEVQREREQLLDKLNLSLEVAGLGVYWQPDIEMEQVQADWRCLDLFGVEGFDWIEIDDLLENLHPDDLPMVQRAAEELRLDQSARLRFRIQHPKRGLRWLELSSEIKESHGQVKLLGIVQDITSQEQQEQGRERLLWELAMSLQIAGFVSFQVDLTVHTFVQPSGQLRDLFGLTTAEVLTTTAVLHQTHAADLEIARTVWEQIAAGENANAVYRLQLPDDQIRWVEIFGSSQKIDESSLMIGIARDITTSKHQESL
jgi:PAS domain S-box-containing protein